MDQEMRTPQMEARTMVIGGCAVEPPRQVYEAIIQKVENGFIVRVGCKVFVFPAWEMVSEALGLYYKSPEEAIKKYCK